MVSCTVPRVVSITYTALADAQATNRRPSLGCNAIWLGCSPTEILPIVFSDCGSTTSTARSAQSLTYNRPLPALITSYGRRPQSAETSPAAPATEMRLIAPPVILSCDASPQANDRLPPLARMVSEYSKLACSSRNTPVRKPLLSSVSTVPASADVGIGG